MCIYSPMPHTLSYCALIGKCALIRSNTVDERPDIPSSVWNDFEKLTSMSVTSSQNGEQLHPDS